MKTADQWIDELPCSDSEFVATDAIKQIQLDAMKEGMRRAANHVDDPTKTNKVRCGITSDEIKLALLTAAEQLTEKDL